MLGECGALLKSMTMTHRYPIDWRTKKPVILRETLQWFADVSHLRQPAAAALEKVNVSMPLTFLLIYHAVPTNQPFTYSYSDCCWLMGR
jgi:valyl-tRNA synthetase